MEINIHKLLGLVKTTIFQLLCPWQISLHPIIAYAGYFFYSLLILWVLSFHIKAVAIFLNHFFILLPFVVAQLKFI